ncbi:formate dehydrogenase subunit gamma [Tropicimonas sp. S265A]|uniref:formate dehydrogenase subunit gamma n=1 Tax=Tropicimonas sp. S265A TaxID=3415134 RepID=UPI003C7B010C
MSTPHPDPRLSDILARQADMQGALLPILHAVQEAFGHIPETARAPIAEALNISRAELAGVISFYHDYRDAPAGRRILKICRAEACQSMGGRDLEADVQALLNLDWGGTTPEGAITLEPVYCLGLCACAPAAMIDDRPIGRAEAKSLVAEARR